MLVVVPSQIPALRVRREAGAAVSPGLRTGHRRPLSCGAEPDTAPRRGSVGPGGSGEQLGDVHGIERSNLVAEFTADGELSLLCQGAEELVPAQAAQHGRSEEPTSE